MPENKLKLLYDAISQDYDLGSYDDFLIKIHDSQKRELFHRSVGQEYELGDYNTFEQKLSPWMEPIGPPTPQQLITQAPVQQPPAQTTIPPELDPNQSLPLQTAVPESTTQPEQQPFQAGVKLTPQLKAQEERTFFDNVAESYNRGIKDAEIDHLMFEAMVGIKDYDRVKDIKESFNERKKVDPIEAQNWLSGVLHDTAKMVGPMVEGMAQGAVAGTGGSLAGPGGFAAGFKLGAAQYWYRQGAGSVYATLKEEGVDEEIAQWTSAIAGIPYAAIEFSQLKILGDFGKTIIKGTATKIAKELAKKYGSTWAKEVTEEILQEGVQIAAEETGKALSNQLKGTEIDQTKFTDVVNRLWQTAKQSAGPLAVITGGPAATTGIRSTISKPEQKEPPSPTPTTKPGQEPYPTPEPGPSKPVAPEPAPVKKEVKGAEVIRKDIRGISKETGKQEEGPRDRSKDREQIAQKEPKEVPIDETARKVKPKVTTITEIKDVDTFKKEIKEKFKLSDEETEAVSEITEARAEKWAETTGRPKEEWYSSHIAEIRESKAEKAKGDKLLAQAAEKGEVPEFTVKNRSEDAIAFGVKARGEPELIKKLKKKQEEYKKEFTERFNKKDLNGAMESSFISQLYREAHEVATGKGGAADYAKTEKLYQEAAPIFYSKMEQVLSEKMPGRSNPTQIRGILNKAGIKQEEIEFSGIEDWLKENDRVLSKEQVLDFIRDNQVEVEEVVKGGATFRYSSGEQYEKAIKEAKRNRDFDLSEDLTAEWEAFEGIGGREDKLSETKYGQYTLPGGEKYRELLITLPVPIKEKSLYVIEKFGSGFVLRSPGDPGYSSPVYNYEAAQRQADYKNEEILRKQGEIFKGGHFDEPNVLSHVRFNERTDSEGNKVLFIEEVQSDWHQKGRKAGYDIKPTEEQRKALNDRLKEIIELKNDLKDPARYRELEEETSAIQRRLFHGGVPDAPFKKTWHELSFRRMVRWAAENGFDKIGWTTGEQQAERYDLADQVNYVDAVKGEEETRVIIEPKKHGTITLNVNNTTSIIKDASSGGSQLQGKTLDEALGKELANKILNLNPHKFFDEKYKARKKELQKRLDDLTKEADKLQYRVEEDKESNDYYNTNSIEKLNDLKRRQRNAQSQLDIFGKVDPSATPIRFEGVDLKVGGEGMKSFYDKILVNYANKYGKKYGARVETEKVKTIKGDITAEGIDPKELGNKEDVGIETYKEKEPIVGPARWYGSLINNRTGFVWTFMNDNQEMVSFGSKHNAEIWGEAKKNQLFKNLQQVSEQIHALPITPDMRYTVINQGQSLFQKAQGAVEFLQDGRAIVHAFETANVSTAVHELAHVFRRDLNDKDMQTVLKWTDQKTWNRAAEEKFARGFERYLRTGKAPTTKLQAVFEKFKKWIGEIYGRIKDSAIDIKITPAVKDVFDRMLGGEVKETKVKAEAAPKTVRQWVASRGRVKPENLAEHGINQREEAGIKLQVGAKKGQGLGLDDLGATAIREGVISKNPSDQLPGEWLLKHIRDNAKIAEIATEGIEEEYDKAQTQDLYKEARSEGAIPDDMELDEFETLIGTAEPLFQEEEGEEVKPEYEKEFMAKMAKRGVDIKKLKTMAAKYRDREKVAKKATEGQLDVFAETEKKKQTKLLKTEGEYKFERPEVEAEYRASHGVTKPSLSGRIKDKLTQLKHELTRGKFEFLPRTKQFAQLRFELLRLGKQKDVAHQKTLDTIDDLVKGMSKKQYGIFERLVLLSDLMEEIQAEHELPGEWTEADVENEHDRLVSEADDAVSKAFTERKRLWEEIKDAYVEAQEAIGHHIKDRFDRSNYFRHQVLEFANAKGLTGTGRRLRTPTGRGFLKRREGSYLSINTNYLQAEYEVMSQMLYDIQRARVIEAVDRTHNIQSQLKSEAKSANEAAIMPYFEEVAARMTAQLSPESERGPYTAEEAFRIVLNTKTAIGMTKLGKLAVNGQLTTEIRGEDYSDVTQELADAYMANKAARADFPDDPEMWGGNSVGNIGRFFAFASAAIKDPDVSNETKLGVATVFKGIREKNQFIKDKLGDNFKTWDSMIPEGYVKWQPREGQVIYFANSIPERAARDLFEGQMEQAGITKDMIRKVMAIGGPRKEFVIEEELAAQLDNLVVEPQRDFLSKAMKWTLTKWKIWTLISPRRYFKYNARNLTGDADAVFIGNPKGFLKTPRAVKELYDVFTGQKKLSEYKDLNNWFGNGGMGTLLQAQEMGDLNKLSQFKKYDAQMEGKTDLNIIRKYFKFARLSTDMREAILRYANYLDYLEQMNESKENKPKNYGASIPEEINALDSNEDKAFWMSNDLLGAYDDISVFGQELRAKFFPFWSWKEVNFKRYVRFIKNASNTKDVAEVVGRRLVTGSPILAMRVGGFMIRAIGLWSLMQAWNQLFFTDEEEDLPRGIKKTPHLIFGRNDKGEVIYFNRLGALGDFLEWFGLEDAPYLVTDFLNGRSSVGEIAQEMAKAPLNVVVQGARPDIKLPFELITSKSLFPDVTKPRTVKDRGFHVARSLGMENEYKAIMGLPSKGYARSLRNFFVYEMDPKQAAYMDIYDAKDRFIRNVRGESRGAYGVNTAKSMALYNMKTALRYEDRQAAEKYFAEYLNLGGTGKGLKRSILSMHPKSGLKKDELPIFLEEYLTPEERKKWDMAVNFFDEVIAKDVTQLGGSQ